MTRPAALDLDDNQLDQLKEWVNLAMGDGAKALGSYTQRFVTLSVPQVNRLPLVAVAAAGRYCRGDTPFHCVVQRFTCADVTGVYLLCITPQSLKSYAGIMDRDCCDAVDEESLLAQLAGLINPVVVPRLAKELGVGVKMGETQLFLSIENFAALSEWDANAEAYNLCFSYALEDAGTATETDSDVPVILSLTPPVALDFVIHGPAAMVFNLGDQFAARLDTLTQR
jgi:hypothetical protein